MDKLSRSSEHLLKTRSLKLHPKSEINFLTELLNPIDEFTFKDEILKYDLEQQPGRREQFDKDAKSILRGELISEDIALFEHKRGRRNGRKIPSLWSSRKMGLPCIVEDAAAEYYHDQGFNVCNRTTFLATIIGRAECMGRIGANKASIFLEEVYVPDDATITNVFYKYDACSSKELAQWVEPAIKLEFEEYTKFNGPYYIDRMQKTFKNNSERHRYLVSSFCSQRFFGVTTLEDLTEACLNAWENVPQQFFQNIFFRSHFFKLGHPDLFIWDENEFRYIEVKSPNDVLQTSQAYFYKYILQPLKIPFWLGRIRVIEVDQ
jgi:hypothetical protein